jgi:hypothetical protein
MERAGPQKDEPCPMTPFARGLLPLALYLTARVSAGVGFPRRREAAS